MRTPLAWDAYADLHQRILNSLPVPPVGEQTRPREGIAITTRIVWADAGQELLATTAVAWTRVSVLVYIEDRRWPVRGVWLAAHDVRRR